MQWLLDGKVTLRANLADSEVTRGMKSGTSSSPLIDFDFCGPKVAHNGFKPMVRENAYDAGELAIATFLQAKAYGKPYVLLPIAMSGRLQHHCIGYNSEFGTLTPKDIEGKRVGVRTYSQTTALWVRGVLQHEYGVDLDKVTWLIQDEAHLAEHIDPPNCEMLPIGTNLAQMLLDGEIDAGLLGNDMPDDPRVRPLIPEPQVAAKAWHAREQIIPVNHMFVVRSELSKQRPDVVRELFRMLVESRAAADPSKTKSMPPNGYNNLRKTIETAVDWSFEQKLIPRRLSVDELFDETTSDLNT